MSLPDLLMRNLSVVFVGTAVTKSSKEANAYYATHGNSFYKTLYKVGITKKLTSPDKYHSLLKDGVGLTDLVKARTALDNELVEDDFDIEAFKQKIIKYKPKIICFNGKLAAAYFLLGTNQTDKIQYGRQDRMFKGSIIFVVPSTAQTAKKYWDIKHWQELANVVSNISKKNIFNRILFALGFIFSKS